MERQEIGRWGWGGEGRVVRVGLGQNSGKQRGANSCNSLGAWERTSTGRELKPIKFGGGFEGVPNIPPQILPTLGLKHLAPPLGAFEGDGDNPTKNSGTCTSAWGRAGAGGGIKPGVPVSHTSGGKGKKMGVPVSHTPNPSTHLAQSTCKGEEPNDPNFVSRKHFEGSGVHVSLSLKPHDLGEMMSPPTVSLEGKEGMTTVEAGG